MRDLCRRILPSKSLQLNPTVPHNVGRPRHIQPRRFPDVVFLVRAPCPTVVWVILNLSAAILSMPPWKDPRPTLAATSTAFQQSA
ncbi:hypothetical protein FA95DRAFT_1608830 [Auriscalpium vulgare]|uniref:Uncharacterized protein n=1 Tax=Auriscalpium vulgare TaxID=40419 RepID=A0ACB8RKE4_9AGAM|nr:hypothetical protein FA95DRAFT_1608830 [Auriscalpium vulgare]